MSKQLKVLLIEDNPGDAFLMKFYLGESTDPTFEVFHGETIKQAYEHLDAHKFDIILMDLNLPDSHGVDSIKSLLGKYPGNLVLVLTGLTDEEVGLETVRFGAQDFLVKGRFDGKVLISSVLFAFERFKLNSKIDQFEAEIDDRKGRFNNLQKILNIGYLEANPDDKTIYLSSNAKTLLNLNVKGYIYGFEEFCSFFSNSAEIQVALAPGATQVQLGDKLVPLQSLEGKLVGVVQ
jgi:DNA-binding response OmpR family regulator